MNPLLSEFTNPGGIIGGGLGTKAGSLIPKTRMYNKLPFIPEEPLSAEKITQLNKILDEKGILPQQKTIN